MEVDARRGNSYQAKVYSSFKAVLIFSFVLRTVIMIVLWVCREPILSFTLDKYILSQPSFGDALITLISHQLAGDISQSSWSQELQSLPSLAYSESDGVSIEEVCLSDLVCIQRRDPACSGLVLPFLNYKGFKALANHRLAHVLWSQGRLDLAQTIQSKCSELYNVDIHPAACIGPGSFPWLLIYIFSFLRAVNTVGLMIDHATGLVIGETATVGANCSFLHGVTLGSSGKERGLRHPQIGNGVLIGCSASILGCISIGDNCKIGSGSIVLKSVPSECTAVGNPARVVGLNAPGAEMPGESMDHALREVVTSDGRLFYSTWTVWADGGSHI